MASRANYDLLPRSSSDLSEGEDGQFKDKPLAPPRSLSRKLRRALRICRPTYILIFFLLFMIWQLIFNGSYGNPKSFELDKKERVYIAANIVNGDLIKGDWGKSLKGLVELIGEDRVHVSIYGSPKDALIELAKGLKCEKSIISEKDEPIDMKSIPRTTLPTGESRIKRIAYLAEVRNKALQPLQKSDKKFDKVLFINDVFFEPMDAARLLWGTNINKEGKAEYKAVCAADFVASWKYYDTFATRDAEGYSIGVPIFPWFAGEGEAISRRDVLEGREAVRVKSCWGGMVAFDGRYFQDLERKETIEGRGEKGSKTLPTLPLRFRSEPEPFWDSSECCLIHADIMASPPFSPPSKDDKYDTGIYMNPFVRVAYDKATHRWINTAKRFERLFALPQGIINKLAHLPVFNIRRTEIEGEIIKDRRWVSLTVPNTLSSGDPPPGNRKEKEFGGADTNWQGSGVDKRAKIGKAKGKEYWDNHGYYEDFDRTATRGGYCAVRQLLVVKEDRKEGEGNWDDLLDEVPPI